MSRCKSYIPFIFFTLLFASCRSGGVDLTIRKIPLEQRRVIFFENFKNNSVGSAKTEFDGFERGFPSMLETDFVNFGVFRAVSEESRHAALKEIAFQESGLVGEPSVRIGKMVGAEFLLTGSFTEFRGTMSIDARIVKIETGETQVAAQASGTTDRTLSPPEEALIKKVSLAILRKFSADITVAEETRLREQIETTKVEAAVHNYRGEEELEQLKRQKIEAEAKKTRVDKEKIEEAEKKAKEQFKEALKDDPRYEKAKKNLDRIIGLLPPTL